MVSPHSPRKILIVCLGNICRSPTAEAVLRARAAEVGLELEVDSAGTGDYHIGDPPDPRAIRHAARRGYALGSLRARQVSREDFLNFDIIFAADEANLRDLQQRCPELHGGKLQLFLGNRPLPDPYHGGDDGFEEVLDLVETRCRELIDSWTTPRKF